MKVTDAQFSSKIQVELTCDCGSKHSFEVTPGMEFFRCNNCSTEITIETEDQHIYSVEACRSEE